MSSANSSPYAVTAVEMVQRFAISEERCLILCGLFRYRAALLALGFTSGFQWIDGSFVEDVESRDGRAPSDVDVVTFAEAPAGLSDSDVRGLLEENPDLFNRDACRAEFRCDTSLINLRTPPAWLVKQTRYWYGLYSHRRGDALWKGMLELPLGSDDDAVQDLRLNRSGQETSNAP